MSLQEEMIQKELFEARMETELEDTAKRIYSKGLKELNNNEAYYVLLSKYTSQDDIVVGSPAVARNIHSTNNLIGVFIKVMNNNVIIQCS